MRVFIRFESVVPNGRGWHPGVFALANGLARDGRLSPEDAAWHRAANERASAMYADPSVVAPGCYDRDANPGAKSWFTSSAFDLLDMTSDYLRLLERYEVEWIEQRTAAPGRVVYEDDVQVVAVPPGEFGAGAGAGAPVGAALRPGGAGSATCGGKATT